MAQDWFDSIPGQAPAPAPAPARPSGPVYGAPKPVEPYRDNQEVRAQQGQANENTRTGIAVQDQALQNREFPMKRGDSLRQDFDGQMDVKNYKSAIPVFLSGLNAAQNATGDLQLMNAYSKVVDPNSVVREGEVNMAGNTDSFVNQLIAKLQKQGDIDGGGNLSANARERLKSEMNTRVAALAKAYGVQRSRFQQLAQRQGVNPEDVVGGYPMGELQVKQYLKAMPGADQEAAARRKEALSSTINGLPTDPEDARKASIAAWGRLILDENGNPLGPDGGVGVDPQTGERGLFGSVTDTTQSDAREAAAQQSRDTVLGGIDATVRGAADVMTAGLSDKIAASIGTIFDGGTYADNLASERAINKRDEKVNPYYRLAGQFGGAAALPLGAEGLGANALRGGVYGGAYGFNSSDKAFTDRGGDVLAGAALGAGGNVLGRAVGNKIGEGVNALRRSSPATQEVSQNMNALLAGERQGIPMRQPDIRPSTRADFAAAEASPSGNPIITKALESDRQAVQGRLSEVGGTGQVRDNFSAGEMVQDAGKRYIARTRQQANALYSRAEKLTGGTNAAPNEAIAAIDRNIAELTQNGANTNAGQIRYLQDLKGDLQSGAMTIDKLRSLRRNMRGQLNERNLTATDAERRVGEVINAASTDIETALQGNKAALGAYRNADAFYRNRQEFIKQVAQNFMGRSDNPISAEQAASRLNAMMKEGGDSQRFSRMWKELEPEEKADLQATFAEAIGKGRNGEFSLAGLATNMRKVNPQTLREVFGADGAAALRDLQAISEAKVATAGALNKSRTGVVAARQNKFQDILLGAVGGGVGGVPGALAGMTARGAIESFSSKRAARLLLNPDFTRWLRQTPNSTAPQVLNRHFERLAQAAAKEPVFAGDVRALQDYLGRAFAQSPSKAAAAENEPNGGQKPPQQ